MPEPRHSWWDKPAECWAWRFVILAVIATTLGLLFYGGKGGGLGLNILAVPVIIFCGLGYTTARIKCERGLSPALQSARLLLAMMGVLFAVTELFRLRTRRFGVFRG